MNSIFRELREKNNISQKELSRKTRISQQAISYIETTGKFPNTENLIKFAKFFNVSTNYLLGVSQNETEQIYNEMSEAERRSWINYGKFIISNRHQ